MTGIVPWVDWLSTPMAISTALRHTAEAMAMASSLKSRHEAEEKI